jgi:Flp pilus assembly protein TadD
MEISANGTPETASPTEVLYSTGYWLYQHERYADAASVFRSLATCVPADERGWLGLGACHEAWGQPEIALEMYGTGRVLAAPAPLCAQAAAKLFRMFGREEDAEVAEEDAQLALEVGVERGSSCVSTP